MPLRRVSKFTLDAWCIIASTRCRRLSSQESSIISSESGDGSVRITNCEWTEPVGCVSRRRLSSRSRGRLDVIVLKPAMQIALAIGQMLMNLFDSEAIVIQIVHAGIG